MRHLLGDAGSLSVECLSVELTFNGVIPKDQRSNNKTDTKYNKVPDHVILLGLVFTVAFQNLLHFVSGKVGQLR